MDDVRGEYDLVRIRDTGADGAMEARAGTRFETTFAVEAICRVHRLMMGSTILMEFTGLICFR